MDKSITLTEQWDGLDAYARALRAAVRGLWNGALSYDQAFDAMMAAIDQGMRKAWTVGGQQCGYQLEDFTPQERLRVEAIIGEQKSYIASLLDYVEAHSKANKGAWGDVVARLELWHAAYRSTAGEAAAIACADKKMMFVMGPTSDHCRSCAGLNGRVYRYSVWAANGAVPPTGNTECGGWRCLCELVETDARVTPGPFPVKLLK